MSIVRTPARLDRFPWEPESANRASLAAGAIRRMLIGRELIGHDAPNAQ